MTLRVFLHQVAPRQVRPAGKTAMLVPTGTQHMRFDLGAPGAVHTLTPTDTPTPTGFSGPRSQAGLNPRPGLRPPPGLAPPPGLNPAAAAFQPTSIMSAAQQLKDKLMTGELVHMSFTRKYPSYAHPFQVHSQMAWLQHNQSMLCRIWSVHINVTIAATVVACSSRRIAKTAIQSEAVASFQQTA